MVAIAGPARFWLPRLAAVALLVLVGSCRNKSPSSAVSTSQTRAANLAAPVSIPKAAQPPVLGSPPGTQAQAHDPEHPPIDCPLRKLGVDPLHLRPFDQVEKYIAFLEKPDRAIWQKPDEVVKTLGLKGTETLVDVGAGSGYFSFRFARALPRGKVIADDTEAEMIRHIYHRAMSEGIRNIEAKIIKPDDPAVSKDADLVFICDVLHHVPDRLAWLSRIASEMKPEARLALIEFKEGKLPQGPPESAKIPRPKLIALAAKAGLVFDRDAPLALPYQVFLLFHKPG